MNKNKQNNYFLVFTQIDDSLEKSETDLDASADMDSDDFNDRKNRQPLTPSMCSSPASPALSTGRYFKLINYLILPFLIYIFGSQKLKFTSEIIKNQINIQISIKTYQLKMFCVKKTDKFFKF